VEGGQLAFDSVTAHVSTNKVSHDEWLRSPVAMHGGKQNEVVDDERHPCPAPL